MSDDFEDDGWGEGDDDGWGDGEDPGEGEDWGDTTLVDPNAEDPDLGFTEVKTEEKKAEDLKKQLAKYKFSTKAFGKLEERKAPSVKVKDLRSKIPSIMKASVKGVAKMRSFTRDSRPVIDIIGGIYQKGLFTLGGPTSGINKQVIPAIRYIFHAANEMKPKDINRVAMLRKLAEAVQDCQQVQAREILRIFGDLTNQNQTFESQIQYLLLKQKEETLDRFISQFHKDCDEDHTKVKPAQQRAHLKSAYLDMLGDQFGLEAVEAARGDRFLNDVRKELDNGVWGGVSVSAIFLMLRKQLSIELFIQYILADINNQSDNADRLLDRDCIFKWVEKNMSTDDAHLVFWDEDRVKEFEGQDPNKPADKNKFNPFLSQKFLLRILVEMKFIERK